MAGALTEEFPEVEHVTQLVKANSLIENGDNGVYVEGIYATADFFKVFSFSVISGDLKTALVDPNSIILSKSLAEKLFGTANPMGATLTLHTLSSESENDRKELTVTAVVEDPPANSHISFEYITPTANSHELGLWFGNWQSNNYFTYASLHDGQSESAFAEKLAPLAQRQHIAH